VESYTSTINKNNLSSWSILNYVNYEFQNPDNDTRGSWFSGSISFSEERSNKHHLNYFEIKSPSGITWKRQWQRSKEEMTELINQKKIFFGIPPKYQSVPRIKIFPDDIDEQIPTNIIDNVETTRDAQKKLDALFDNRIFDYPKPISLIKHLVQLSSKENSIILDFMAGSGTTGHAVLELNKEDNGNRKFILCTNNENNNGNGYKIAEDICYPRIKKVIEGYKNVKGKQVAGLGGNIKYFKTDFVNYKEPTDENKIKLTTEATEMLCIKEGTFEPVCDKKDFKLFKNASHHTGIIWHTKAIQNFKKVIKDITGKINIYIFSLGDETFDEEFEDVKHKIKLSPIPEAILRVYRRIFK